MTTETTSLTVTYMDPTDLHTDLNIRGVLDLDGDGLAASVAELGVLEPVIAVRRPDGRVRVRFGGRRTAAAARAGRMVPVIVTGGEGDDRAETIARIAEQWAENKHRTALTAADEARAVQGLLDLDVTPAQVRKRLGVSKDDITAARAITGSGAAATAAELPDITLDQAAVLAGFDDDPEAFPALTDALSEGPGQFAHIAAQMTATRDSRAARRAATAELTAAGVTVWDGHPHYMRRVDSLISADGEVITAAGHAACPGHGAWLINSTEPGEDGDPRPACTPIYGCADPAAHTHRYRYDHTPPRRDQMSGEAAEEARAAARRIREGNVTWRAATEVRRAWLTEFGQRPRPPAGQGHRMQAAVATAWARGDLAARKAIEQGHGLAAVLLGCTEPGSYGDSRAKLAEAITGSRPPRVEVITFMLLLGAYEEHLTGDIMWQAAAGEKDRGGWRAQLDDAGRYLLTLETFGYHLSELEQKVAEVARPAPEIPAVVDVHLPGDDAGELDG